MPLARRSCENRNPAPRFASTARALHRLWRRRLSRDNRLPRARFQLSLERRLRVGSSLHLPFGFGWSYRYLPVVPVKTGTQHPGSPAWRGRCIGFGVGGYLATTDCPALGSSFRWNDGFGWNHRYTHPSASGGVTATSLPFDFGWSYRYLPVVPVKTGTQRPGLPAWRGRCIGFGVGVLSRQPSAPR